MKIRLKPVIYTTNTHTSGAKNDIQQKMLLKALQITQDPKKLREMIGVRTVAEVYKTLDKMSMRKDYHAALAKNGISFDFIVGGIKSIAVTAEHDGDKLKAYQTLLRSVGMDKYDSENLGGEGTWEETLLKKIEEDKAKNQTLTAGTAPKSIKYEVVVPQVPDSVKAIEKEEDDLTSSLYE